MSQRNMPDTLMTKDGVGRSPYHSAQISLEEMSLRCVSGPHQGEEWPLTQELILIGRGDWCDIPLFLDVKASRHHCELRLSSEGIHISDLGSSNGTYIGEVPIFDGLILPGMKLHVGQSIFSLCGHTTKRSISIEYHDKSGLLVGQNTRMKQLFLLLSRLAKVDETVMFYGETGTGKSSMAQALHEQSGRAGQPFVTVNCGALPRDLVESMLFGYEKGAFTGANQRHKGFFEQADGGTLFLDEITELPLPLQPKLLDVLERKKLRRLGGEQETSVDFRLVAATHQNLQVAVQQRQFREDLFYRIAVVEETIPPLRQRLEDIPLLTHYLLASLRPTEQFQLTQAAILKLQNYLWPGNVRQLRNVLARSLVLFQGNTLDADDIAFPSEANTLRNASPQLTSPALTNADSPQTLQEQLEQFEIAILLRTLDAHDWNVPQAANVLGIARSSLYNRINKYQLQRA